VQGMGPIPPGRYYITEPYIYTSDPRSKYFYRRFFKLFADDGQIDDSTTYKGVTRGQLRFHPGMVSLGCVTMPNIDEWDVIQHRLLNTKTDNIPGTNTRYYGTVTVK